MNHWLFIIFLASLNFVMMVIHLLDFMVLCNHGLYVDMILD
jgi:hypothetical protein